MKARMILVAGAVAVLAALSFLSQSRAPSSSLPAPPQESAQVPAGGPPLAGETRESRGTSASPPVPEPPVPGGAASGEPEPLIAPKLALQTGVLPWEADIARITKSSALSEGAKSAELVVMLHRLPEEALETAARQCVLRLPDRDYAPVAAALINPQTHGMALSVFFEDLLSRPDALTLPTLLSIARMPAHPFAGAALDNLELLLGKAYGTDWQKWDAEVRTALGRSRSD